MSRRLWMIWFKIAQRIVFIIEFVRKWKNFGNMYRVAKLQIRFKKSALLIGISSLNFLIWETFCFGIWYEDALLIYLFELPEFEGKVLPWWRCDALWRKRTQQILPRWRRITTTWLWVLTSKMILLRFWILCLKFF